MPLLSTPQSPLPFHTIFSTYAKRPLPSLHLKVVHTHWLKLFNFLLFRIVSFYKSLHYAPYFLQTLHNICIIKRPKSPETLINTKLIYPRTSLSGVGSLYFVTLHTPVKPYFITSLLSHKLCISVNVCVIGRKFVVYWS